jgi:hypothetical protein
VGVEVRDGAVPPTNRFLRGDNLQGRPIDRATGVHLKYSFQAAPGTLVDRLHGSVYQGLGVGAYTFGNRQELGNPWLAYIFQGARIGRLTPGLSVNYEWQFGLSWGWQPWSEENFCNTSIGSRVNAYLNGNIYLDWAVAPRLDLTAGVSAMHFSSGNTRLPNAGINAVMFSLGAIAYLDRDARRAPPRQASPPPAFTRRFSHELLLFGSWRSKSFRLEDNGPTLLSNRSFGVSGLSWATLYHLDRHFRAGASLDGVYDSSAGIGVDLSEIGVDTEHLPIIYPPVWEQMALGVSLRGDFVMPYFTLSAGLGYNVLHTGDDLSSFYQTLALKTHITPRIDLHIGYRLKRFHSPNFLMLGIAYRITK